MFKAVKSDYLVPSDGSFKVKDWPTVPPDGFDLDQKDNKKEYKKKLAKKVDDIADLQRVLYADDRYSLLLIFQAMDAAGKDSTIRNVLSGVNPAGFQVFSFKQPSSEELDHDYLWRAAKRLPERGRIGVFNRSYYEETLVVRVHPQLLHYQKLPYKTGEMLWAERFDSINRFEEHLTRNGTVVIKFWLNVSLEEQKKRFISRLDEPEKNYKFSSRDVEERRHWPAYMKAYEEMLNATSKKHAPWYAIPADSKPFMRLTVAEIIKDTLESLDISYPKVDEKEKARFDEMRKLLENE